MAAELLKRIFESEIVPELFPNNTFMDQSINDDANVNGNSVEIQNSGTLPDVLVNNTTWPLAVSQRVDTPDQYIIETLNTLVTQVTDVESLIEAGGANKRASIVQQQASALRTKAASRLIIDWLTGVTNKVPTTGTGSAATLPGATGNRRAITQSDIQTGLEILMNDNIPVDEANKPILLIPARFYRDMMGIENFIQADKLGTTNSPIITGQIGEVLGCRVVMRTLVGRFDATDSLKAEDAADAIGDAHAALLYHPNFVRKAQGAFKFRINENQAEWGGTIMGSELRFGGSPARLDRKGIVAIFEDTV